MSDDRDHWAWKQPLDEFYPLGDTKLFYLVSYIHATQWFDNGTKVPSSVVAKQVMANRKYASQLYTVFKPQVDAFHFDNIKSDSPKPKEPPKPKKPKAKKKNKSEPTLSNVVSFADYKKNKAG